MEQENKDQEIIKALKERAENLLAEIITCAKKLNLDAKDGQNKK